MISLWVGGGVSFLFLSEPSWTKLIDLGQFFLYSVGVLAQVLYMLMKERKITEFPGRNIFLGLTFFLLLICAVVYGGTVFANFTYTPEIAPRVLLLRFLGISILGGSIVLGVLVTTFAEERENVNLDELNQENYNRLSDRLSDSLG